MIISKAFQVTRKWNTENMKLELEDKILHIEDYDTFII